MNIVITGASRGIGLGLTTLATQKDHRVMAVVRNNRESQELRQLANQFKSIQIIETDVSHPNAAAQISEAAAQFGTVDLLINNAGVYQEGHTREDFLQSFIVNSIAPFEITNGLLPFLRKSKNPLAVQITSLMGSIADNTSGGSYAYRASKTALNMITRSIAVDQDWLTTIVIHPGWVKTRMGGSQAPISVEDSVKGIWRVIEKLEPKDSGNFYSFEGDLLPW